MHNRELQSQLQSLRRLIEQTSQACGQDFEMRAHWARYLCVLSAGWLENALREVYQEFVKHAASKPVADFACAKLAQIQNPKTSRFIEVSRSFNPTWGDDLAAYVSDDGRGNAIDSIMSHRHLIAHGRISGITVARLTEYLKKAIQVIEFIEGQCGNQ